MEKGTPPNPYRKNSVGTFKRNSVKAHTPKSPLERGKMRCFSASRGVSWRNEEKAFLDEIKKTISNEIM
ncbi:MAG: hypothetical protein KKF62_06600 [Bacteroidetes bacterium]|nr:hypothetical protein [Bacteroidota bacterium]MBU1798233.1 hypothetical protein [Bacteroidota bacterium]